MPKQNSQDALTIIQVLKKDLNNVEQAISQGYMNEAVETLKLIGREVERALFSLTSQTEAVQSSYEDSQYEDAMVKEDEKCSIKEWFGINETITKEKSGYSVKSSKGKNLGGPYSSKKKAVKRLRQVEYFKNNKR